MERTGELYTAETYVCKRAKFHYALRKRKKLKLQQQENLIECTWKISNRTKQKTKQTAKEAQIAFPPYLLHFDPVLSVLRARRELECANRLLDVLDRLLCREFMPRNRTETNEWSEMREYLTKTVFFVEHT